jgi:hypothetical protein
MAMDRRLLLLAVALAAAASSCTVKAPTVAFTTICAPPDGGSCTFSDTCDAQYIGPSVMDVSVTSQLWLAVEVHNQAVDNTDETIGRGNTQDAYLQKIDVSYSGAVAIPATSTPMQQRVPAGGTAVLSIFPVPASAGLTNTSVLAGSSAVVIAKVKGKGIFGDDTSFETPVYEIPVTICNGCLGPMTCPDPTQTVVALCPPNDGQLPTGAPACQ